MVQAENSKVRENWNNSWHGVMNYSGISIKPQYNHRPAYNVKYKVQSNPVNANGDGTIEGVRINGVSVLSGLKLKKM